FQRRDAIPYSLGTLDPHGMSQRLYIVSAMRIRDVDHRLLFPRHEKRREARQRSDFKLRVELPQRLDGASVIAAGLHEDIHIEIAARTSGRATDGMGRSKDEWNLLGGQRAQNIIEIDR